MAVEERVGRPEDELVTRAHAAEDGDHVARGDARLHHALFEAAVDDGEDARRPLFHQEARAGDDGHRRLAGVELDGGEHAREEGAVGVVDLGLDGEIARGLADGGADVADRAREAPPRVGGDGEGEGAARLHRGDARLGDGELEAQGGHGDEGDDLGVLPDVLAGLDVALGDHAGEGGADRAVADDLRRRAGARLGGGERQRRRLALVGDLVVLGLADGALLEEPPVALALALGRALRRAGEGGVGLRLGRAEGHRAHVEPGEEIALLHRGAALDEGLEHPAGGVGGEVGLALAAQGAGERQGARHRLLAHRARVDVDAGDGRGHRSLGLGLAARERRRRREPQQGEGRAGAP